MFSTFLGVSARIKNPCLYPENVPKKRPFILEESLPGGKLVKCFKIIRMNNKTHPTRDRGDHFKVVRLKSGQYKKTLRSAFRHLNCTCAPSYLQPQ